MNRFLVALAAAPLASAAPPVGWKTCGGLDDALSNVACPATSTCVRQKWSPSAGNWGCVDGVNATSCGDYTACPAGYTCANHGSGWRVISTCIGTAGNATGVQVCKQGAPLPMASDKKNVLVLGDSVSIGYTPFVNAALADVALVQHSPWGGDGGAEESAYGDQCLDYLLRAPDGTPLRPNLLFFNFGLHNTGSGTLPGQAGPTSEYAPHLQSIVSKLSKWAAPAEDGSTGAVRLMFGLTSPMLDNAQTDAVITGTLNAQAAKIMADAGIPTLDMHAAITAKCGAAPQKQCFGETGCFSPHCVPAGYEWLANTTIAPAIRKALL